MSNMLLSGKAVHCETAYLTHYKGDQNNRSDHIGFDSCLDDDTEVVLEDDINFSLKHYWL